MFRVILLLALVYAFLNGYKDSPSIVAVVVFSRALNPRPALLLTAAAQLVAPALFGIAVARTIGTGVLRPAGVNPIVVLAALAGALMWNLLTWYLGLPSSSSHGLVGGLVGAGLASGGWGLLEFGGLGKVLLSLLVSPVLGLAGGYAAMRWLLRASRRSTPRVNRLFRRLQIPALIALALSHGTNDPPKTMAMVTLGLIATGAIPEFTVPLWVIAVSVGAFCLGTSLAGWRIMRALGARIFRVRPIHGLAALLGGAGVILGSGLVGAPVSATHVMSTAIMGAGAADRLNRVRWGVTGGILWSWILTLPMSAGLAALAAILIRRLGG